MNQHKQWRTALIALLPIALVARGLGSSPGPTVDVPLIIEGVLVDTGGLPYVGEIDITLTQDSGLSSYVWGPFTTSVFDGAFAGSFVCRNFDTGQRSSYSLAPHDATSDHPVFQEGSVWTEQLEGRLARGRLGAPTEDLTGQYVLDTLNVRMVVPPRFGTVSLQTGEGNCLMDASPKSLFERGLGNRLYNEFPISGGESVALFSWCLDDQMILQFSPAAGTPAPTFVLNRGGEVSTGVGQFTTVTVSLDSAYYDTGGCLALFPSSNYSPFVSLPDLPGSNSLGATGRLLDSKYRGWKDDGEYTLLLPKGSYHLEYWSDGDPQVGSPSLSVSVDLTAGPTTSLAFP